MKIYIAGKITGDPNYRNKFKAVEDRLVQQGHMVMNPAVLPEGFEHEEYMRICLIMIDVCDCIYMLPDWKESKGAILEHEHAWDKGKYVLYI